MGCHSKMSVRSEQLSILQNPQSIPTPHYYFGRRITRLFYCCNAIESDRHGELVFLSLCLLYNASQHNTMQYKIINTWSNLPFVYILSISIALVLSIQFHERAKHNHLYYYDNYHRHYLNHHHQRNHPPQQTYPLDSIVYDSVSISFYFISFHFIAFCRCSALWLAGPFRQWQSARTTFPTMY